MITGYNTDIRHRGVVFHVQTEDKGVNNPSIETLVYVGGQILHRRRTEYSKELKDGAGKEQILEMLEDQHRSLIAEIKTGGLDAEAESRVGPLGDAKPAAPSPAAAASSGSGGLTQAGEASLQSLDQVILDYLNMEAEQEYLILAMDALGELRLGSPVELAFHAKTSNTSAPVAGAEITVKLISTDSEPAVLGEGKTDAEGQLGLRVSIPSRKGTAALIVSAASEAGTAEIKHLI